MRRGATRLLVPGLGRHTYPTPPLPHALLPQYARECLIMADMGCVALDWDHEAQGLPEDAPIVILLPGNSDNGCLRLLRV